MNYTLSNQGKGVIIIVVNPLFSIKKGWASHFGIICFSVLLVISSLLIPVKISNNLEMNYVELGHPIRYLVQDIGRRDPPTFPIEIGIMTPLEYPILEIRAGAMLVNITIISLLFEAFLLIYRLILTAYRNNKPNNGNQREISCNLKKE